MRFINVSATLLAGALLAAMPAMAQSSDATKQPTQDGNSPTIVGPGSQAYKQRTQDGNSPTIVGPGSQAYKQRTQSLSHGDVPAGVTKQN